MKVMISCLVMFLAVVATAGFKFKWPFSKSKDEKEVDKCKLVPDLVEKAKDTVTIKFPCGAEVLFGSELTPTQVKDNPSIFYKADVKCYYTLVFVDVDYSNDNNNQFMHGLWVNIPGDEVGRGEAIAPYISSGPLKGSGYHRYTFLVFKQPGKLEFDEPRLDNKSIEGRDGFSTSKFVKKYNLVNPVAANFYCAKYDEYVPILYKRMGAEHLLKES